MNEQEFIDKIKKEFSILEDGYRYYFPCPNRGGLSAEVLRMIANELDRANEVWNKSVNDYFATH